MSGRVEISEAERQLGAAGYATERGQQGNILFFLAARLSRGKGGTYMPTKLEAQWNSHSGTTVSAHSVKRQLNKARLMGNATTVA